MMFKKDVFDGRERLVNSRRWQTVQMAFSVNSVGVFFFSSDTLCICTFCMRHARAIAITSYLELQFSWANIVVFTLLTTCPSQEKMHTEGSFGSKF